MSRIPSKTVAELSQECLELPPKRSFKAILKLTYMGRRLPKPIFDLEGLSYIMENTLPKVRQETLKELTDETI